MNTNQENFLTQRYRVADKDIYFYDALAAQEYAKQNPGSVVVRFDGSLEKTNIVNHTKRKLLNISPQMIIEHLDRFVISQDEAKKDIALAIYYHKLRMEMPTQALHHSNGPVMLIGQTGTGKTYTVQKACEFVDAVFVHVDVSSMVPEGIVGFSINDIGVEILQKAGKNMKKAKYAVVFLDEVDKLFNSQSKASIEVSNQLLRLLEGTTLKIDDKTGGIAADKHKVEFDTSNIQFILGGAFQWIYESKSSKKESVGFAQKTFIKEKNSEITLEDLYESAIPKEILGRMNTIVNLQSLSLQDYYKILKESQNSPLREYISKIEVH